MFAGKLGKWYQGMNLVAQALPDDWQLFLVGDGPCRAEFEQHPNVKCIGRQDLTIVGDYVRAADICVMPVNDCSPIATSEYLACGKPIVHMGNHINWMIEDGVNGFIAKNSVNSWHEKLIEAYNAGDEIAQNAINTPHTWSSLQRQMKDWLEELK